MNAHSRPFSQLGRSRHRTTCLVICTRIPFVYSALYSVMPSTYRDSASVLAHRIIDDCIVQLNMTNLSLFSSGAFSNVYKGIGEDPLIQKQFDIAIKKTWKNAARDAQTITQTLPEIDILKTLGRLNHKNVVKLLYEFACTHTDKVCHSLVFEFLPQTLHSYMKARRRNLDTNDVKLFTWQLFRGQAHLQKANIMHRDIKPQNLLVEETTGLLKISDFGSSAIIRGATRQPSYHVTRYYRPPELLLEAKTYGCEIDIWSCGCVFGEMLAGKTFLPGRSASHQLDLVVDMLGIPDRKSAAAMHCPVRTFEAVQAKPVAEMARYPRWHSLLPDTVDPRALKLLEQILVYAPQERLCGLQLLMDEYFQAIFDPTSSRDGRKIGCLGREDHEDVRNGDGCITAESVSVD